MNQVSARPLTNHSTLTAQQGAQLIANGFEPVVVNGKAAIANGWQTGAVTVERMATERAQFPHAQNTGLRTGRLVGVDIDLLDPAQVEAIRKLAFDILGPTDFMRVGQKGLLLCYRNDTATRKITIAVKGARKIEILGKGQQFVAYGIHPDSGQPYRWIGPDVLGCADPLTQDISLLPPVTPEQLREFATKAAALLEQLGYGTATVSLAGYERKRAAPHASSGKRLSFEKLRMRLSYIHPQFDGARPVCYPALGPRKKALPYDSDAWLGMALCLRDGDIPLLDDKVHDWFGLAEDWSDGTLWHERTGEWPIITTFPKQGIKARLGGRKCEGREGEELTTVATIILYAADGG
jgi:hypothetical protein